MALAALPVFTCHEQPLTRLTPGEPLGLAGRLPRRETGKGGR